MNARDWALLELDARRLPHLAPHARPKDFPDRMAPSDPRDMALAERMIMDPTTLTRNLRPIERDGLVKQVADPEDRRARLLHLTARGRAAFEKARPAWAKAQRHMETTLGEGDVEVINAVLDRSLARLAS